MGPLHKPHTAQSQRKSGKSALTTLAPPAANVRCGVVIWSDAVLMKFRTEQCKTVPMALRYFNVFGPRQDPSSPYSGVISLFAGLAQKGEAASIFGDGSQTRDFIYVDDVVRANLLAGDLSELNQAMVLNVGTGSSVSILELWESLCHLVGRELIPPCFLPPREGDVLHSVCDPGRASALLDFRSKIPMEMGLKATLAFLA